MRDLDLLIQPAQGAERRPGLLVLASWLQLPILIALLICLSLSESKAVYQNARLLLTLNFLFLTVSYLAFDNADRRKDEFLAMRLQSCNQPE